MVDDRTETLILGSLPGKASLMAGRYYAHPRNQFWRLMGAVIDRPLPALNYDERLRLLLDHRIGLWDVVGEACRAGSLDTAIRDASANDLLALARSLPVLKVIAFNGRTAARIGWRQLGSAHRFRVLDLPSSSPAHVLAFDVKRAAWQALSHGKSS